MKIEILTQPEKNTEQVERVLRTAANGLRVQAQINKTSNFAAYSHLAINPSQTPIVIIEGQLEFAGRVPDLDTVRKRMSEIRSQRGDVI